MAHPIIALLSVITAVIFVTFYIYRKYFCHRYFKKLGIPGPEPHWLFGNLREFWATKDRHLLLQKWSQQYGKIYGYYEGSTPILAISDADAVESVCVKQFSSFPGRKSLSFIPEPHKYPNNPLANVTSLWGEQWKRLRTIVNPGFSTGRLKSYSPLVAKSQKEFMQLFSNLAQSTKPFEASEQFQYLAIDVIAEVAFGIELNSITNRGESNPILPILQQLIKNFVTNDKPIVKLSALLPEIAPVLQAILMQRGKNRAGLLAPMAALRELCAQVIDKRITDPSLKRNDLLQMLVDAMDDSTTSSLGAGGKLLKPLTPIEVLSQTIQFFQAGTNTTRFTLSYATFCLAANPDCQERLFQEIIEHFPGGSDIEPDYDTVMKMDYLDWFIHETLRLYPVAVHFVTRFVNEPTEINGIPVASENSAIQIDVWTIHQDADLWGPVSPTKFHPERFSPEYPTTSSRPASAFLGFGFGPRTCLGMRFALYELKLTLVNIVRRFKVMPPEGGYPYEMLPVQVAVGMLPRDGVWVRLAERDDSN